MGKALNEARVYRTTDNCWLLHAGSQVSLEVSLFCWCILLAPLLCLLTNFPCLLVKINLFWVFNVHVCLWNFWFVLVKSAISLRNPNRCLLNPNLCWFKSPHSCVRLPEGINRESIDIPFISSHFKIPWNSQIVPFEKSGWYPHWHPQYIIVSPHFASPTSPCLRVFHGSERGLEAAWPPKNPRGKPVGETNE